jgi:hypothetical protein
MKGRQLLIALCFVTTSSTWAESLPQRKPGLWEMAVSGAQGPGQSIKQCIDAQSEKQFQQTGTEAAEKMGGRCSKNTFAKTSNGYAGEAECEVSGSKMLSKTKITGDFNSEYKVEVSTSFIPPFLGQSTSSTTIVAKRLGDCTPGMKPGDMILANGMKMNADDVSNMAQTGAELANSPQFKEMMNNPEIQKAQAEMMKKMMQK